MRDAVYYDRSAYAVALVGRLAQCADILQLNEFPFAPSVYEEILLKEYWNGKYFKADRRTTNFSADSALMPFFLRVVDDQGMAHKTLDYINETGLNLPYPMKYGEKPSKNFAIGLAWGHFRCPIILKRLYGPGTRPTTFISSIALGETNTRNNTTNSAHSLSGTKHTQSLPIPMAHGTMRLLPCRPRYGVGSTFS